MLLVSEAAHGSDGNENPRNHTHACTRVLFGEPTGELLPQLGELLIIAGMGLSTPEDGPIKGSGERHTAHATCAVASRAANRHAAKRTWKLLMSDEMR